MPKKTLVGLWGLLRQPFSFPSSKFEGTRLIGYLDPVGIPTKRMGDTANAVVGQRYSEVECRELLERQLIAHAERALRCTPGLKGHAYQFAAAVSFAYNVGTSAYCGSATAKRFNAGEWRGAYCAMNQSDVGRLQWAYSDGRALPGLVKRCAEESACARVDP